MAARLAVVNLAAIRVVGGCAAGADGRRFAGVVEGGFAGGVAQRRVGAAGEQVFDDLVPAKFGGGEEGGLALVFAVVDVGGESGGAVRLSVTRALMFAPPAQQQIDDL